MKREGEEGDLQVSKGRWCSARPMAVLALGIPAARRRPVNAHPALCS